MEPTKKLKEYGVNTLTTSELLSLIIQGKDSIAVAEDVVAYTESIGDLARIMPEELESINGIGKNKACAVSAAIELAKRLNTEKKQRVKATNTELVFDYVAPLLRHETREHIAAVKEELEEGYIGRCVRLEFEENDITYDETGYRLGEKLFEEIGEVSEGWEMTAEQEIELSDMLAKVAIDYINAHNLQPTCYKVVDIEEVSPES